jgi:Lamin Tail Domain
MVAALPNPAGTDAGHESVTLVNTTPGPVDLAGWVLADAAGGRQVLSGVLESGGDVRVALGSTVPLGNRGDTLTLFDPQSQQIDQVTYQRSEVRAGRTICFGR